MASSSSANGASHDGVRLGLDVGGVIIRMNSLADGDDIYQSQT